MHLLYYSYIYSFGTSFKATKKVKKNILRIFDDDPKRGLIDNPGQINQRLNLKDFSPIYRRREERLGKSQTASSNFNGFE